MSTTRPEVNQSGFTVVEIMIALALGIILSSALVQIFTSSRTLAAMETSLTRVQETGRFAMEAIAKDVRMAGYQGCADPNDLDLIVIATKFQGSKFNSEAIRGYEVASDGKLTPALDAGSDLVNLEGVARPGSDVVLITFANTSEATLNSATSNSANIQVNGQHGLKQEDFALISDCKSAHLFEVVNVPNNSTVNHGGSVNNPHNKLDPGYQPGAKLFKFESRAYYVADTNRKSSSGATVYALYVRDLKGNSQEILEGVESLQILYGQQLPSGQIRYVRATDGDLDWDQVVSVRLGMLVQSFEQVADKNDTGTYELPGASISHTSTDPHPHAGDKSLRKPFTATIKLRNRRQKI